VRRYRFLFEQLVRREMRQKYAGSALGVVWYVVNPLVLMGAYTLMFGLLIPQGIPDYPIFLMVGLIVWTFFSQSLLAAAPSPIDQAGLVRKARFPRETIPAASVVVQLVTFLVVLVVLVPIALAIRGTASWALLLLPVLLAGTFAFVLGCCLAVAALHAHFRDVSPIVSAVLLPWFFLSPIFFQAGQFGFVERNPWVGTILDWVNPVAPFIEATRRVIYGGVTPGFGRLLYVIAGGVLVLVCGRLIFRKLEPELAVVL
jgi:ABC-type polysaccharide/polyol phosphate export permease